MRQVFALMLCCLPAAPAAAGDLVVGLGAEESLGAGDDGDIAGTLEWHAAPIWSPGGAELGFGVAGRLDGGGDIWAGAGLSGLIALGPSWMLEGSVMPGAYADSDDDLGSGFEVRSLLGLGYRVAPRTVLGVSVEHMSNAGVSDDNPGLDTLSLRLRRAF